MLSDLTTVAPTPIARMRFPRSMTAMAVAAAAPPLTAEHAVLAAQRGEAAGWDWIFERYYRSVLRYCTARIGDREQSQDAAQEVFVAAVSALGRLRDRSEPGIEGWLLGIAKFKCVDRIRALRRERSLTPVAPGVADASEVVLGRLDAGRVRRALERLGESQREVIVRRFLLDQSLEQVAAATGRPVGAVKSMQHRALAQLARLCTEAG